MFSSISNIFLRWRGGKCNAKLDGEPWSVLPTLDLSQASSALKMFLCLSLFITCNNSTSTKNDINVVANTWYVTLCIRKSSDLHVFFCCFLPQLQQLFVKTVKSIEQQVKSDSMNRRLTNHLTYVNFIHSFVHSSLIFL